MLRFLKRAIRPFLCILPLALATPAAADDLAGEFFGLDKAAKMRLSVSPAGDGYAVSVVGPDGVRRDATLEKSGADARGQIDGAPVILNLSPRPAGLVMVWAPLDEDGAPIKAKTAAYAFIREGMALPAPPPAIARVAPPSYNGAQTDALGFLYNYEFWEPQAVSWGFSGMKEKYRTLTRLFPMVHTDVLWKICGAKEVPAGAAEALRGLGVTCAQVVSAIAASQRNDKFARFKEAMQKQKADLIRSVECGRGMHNREICAAASKVTAQAATSLQTVASVVQALR